MKSRIFTFLTFLLALTLLTACGTTASSNNDAPKAYGYADNLVGCWIQEPDEDGYLCAYQFLSDGTYLYRYEEYDQNDWHRGSAGTWYTEQDGTIFIHGSISSYRFISKDLVEFSQEGETIQMKRYDKNLGEIGDTMPRPDVWDNN